MNKEIVKLIALQEIDSELAQYDRQIEEQQQEIAAREHSIQEKEEAIASCREKITELEQRQRDINTAHDDAAVRLKDRQNKIMHVQTSKEHQALLKEIEDSKKILKETEEQLLRIMEENEQLKQEIQELENLCTGEKKLLAEESDKVQKAVTVIAGHKEEVAKKREKLTAELRDSVLKRYNMLLQKRAGLAVVQAIDGVCQGCFMTTPPQQFNEIRKGDKMNLCPSCQRILYYLEPELEEAANA